MYIRHCNQVLKRQANIKTETELIDECFPESPKTTTHAVNDTTQCNNDNNVRKSTIKVARRSERIR